MKKRIFDSFLSGLGSVLNIGCTEDYIYPKKGDLMKDRIQLGKDAAIVSKDLHSVTKKAYGKISLGQD